MYQQVNMSDGQKDEQVSFTFRSSELTCTQSSPVQDQFDVFEAVIFSDPSAETQTPDWFNTTHSYVHLWSFPQWWLLSAHNKFQWKSLQKVLRYPKPSTITNDERYCLCEHDQSHSVVLLLLSWHAVSFRAVSLICPVSFPRRRLGHLVGLPVQDLLNQHIQLRLQVVFCFWILKQHNSCQVHTPNTTE